MKKKKKTCVCPPKSVVHTKSGNSIENNCIVNGRFWVKQRLIFFEQSFPFRFLSVSGSSLRGNPTLTQCSPRSHSFTSCKRYKLPDIALPTLSDQASSRRMLKQPVLNISVLCLSIFQDRSHRGK